jgi:hypothetical protein
LYWIGGGDVGDSGLKMRASDFLTLTVMELSSQKTDRELRRD